MKLVVPALCTMLCAPACIVGENAFFQGADAGTDDEQQEPPSVPDAAVTATFGVILSPRHGQVVEDRTEQATFEFAGFHDQVGSSRVDLQACKLEYSIVSPK